MTITQQKLEAAQTEVGNILHNIRSCYVNGMSLRYLYAEKERTFRFNLCEHPAPEIFKITNGMGHMNGLIRSDFGSDFGTLKILLDLSESSAEFQEAYALIQPLIDRVTELEAEILAETAALSQAEARLREAEEAVRLSAEEKLANDPSVIAARKALEAAHPALVPAPAEPPPLIRGRQKLEAAIA